METILKKVGHIALLCLAIAAIWFATYTVADYVIHQFLMYRRTDTTLACALLITGVLPFPIVNILMNKVRQVGREIKESFASGGQTTRSSNTSRPKRVFVDGKFVNVDSVDDVTPKNGETSSGTQPPQGGSNSSWRDRAEKAQETAGKWANAAWDTATPWAKAQGEAVARHAEQKPLIFWGGGLIVAALLFASKSITLFACLILAAIACFFAHKNKAAVGEALSKLGPVSVACILVVVGGMLAYDEVEAGLMLILTGCAFLVGLASYHVYKQSGSYAKGAATAGVCLFLVSFILYKIGLLGYPLLIGLSGAVLLAIGGIMYWFTKKYPPAKKTKEDLEKQIEEAKAKRQEIRSEAERKRLETELALMQGELKAVADLAAALKAAGASQAVIDQAVLNHLNKSKGQQRKKK